MLITALDHVQIAAPAGSEDAMRAFYCGVLGCREVAKPAQLASRGGLWLDCGNMQMHIGIDTPPPSNASSRRHVAFLVNDMEQVRAALQRAGAAIEEDTAPLDDCARCYTRDPAGNRIEFLRRRAT